MDTSETKPLVFPMASPLIAGTLPNVSTVPMQISSSVNIQPYVSLNNMNTTNVMGPSRFHSGITAQEQMAGLVMPSPLQQGHNIIQNSILSNNTRHGQFSVVQCQNGTLLIPSKGVAGTLLIPTKGSISSANTGLNVSNSEQNATQSVTVVPTARSTRSKIKGGGPSNIIKAKPMTSQHQCTQCSKIFSKKSHFVRHKLTHISAKPQKHDKTRHGYLKPRRDSEHSPNNKQMSRSHNDVKYYEKFICTVCDRVFLNKSVLVNHMLTHVREVYQCSLCRRSFNVENKLKEHLKSHSEKQSKGCDETFGETCKEAEQKSKQGKVEQLKTAFTEKSQTSEKNQGKRRSDGCEPCDTTFTETSVSIKKEPDEDKAEDTETDMDIDTKEEMPQTKTVDTGTFEDFYYDTDSTESGTDGDDDDNSSYPKCTLCDKSFTTTQGWKRHMERGHDKKYPCTLCDKEFTQRNLLLRHIDETHEEVAPHLCTLCNKKFKSLKALKMHRRCAHGDEKQFQCEECSEWFKYKEQLRSHARRAHTIPQQHICTVCKKTFTRKSDLYFHSKSCTTETFDGTSYRCDFPGCDKKFPNNKKVYFHRYNCHIKRFKCTHCDKAFGQKVELNIHMGHHGAEKKFMCHLCSKVFIVQDLLRKHMVIHQNRTKSFKCDQCDSAYYEQSQLRHHIKLKHKGEIKHLCNICGASLTSATNLRQHMLTHSGERPHKCTQCDAAFTQEQNLKRHQVILQLLLFGSVSGAVH